MPAEAPGPQTAGSVLFSERVRTEVSTAALAPTVLQRELPPEGAEVVAVEGPATLPRNGGRPTETEGAKLALPGAGQKPKSTTSRGGERGREGNQ